MSESNPGTAVAVAQPSKPTAVAIPDGYQPIRVAPPGRLPNQEEFAMMRQIASLAIEASKDATDATRPLPKGIKTVEQAMMVMLAGHEVGMPPQTSLRRLFIVNGKIELETQALMGLVRAYDPAYDFHFRRYDHGGCIVDLYHGERLIFTGTYDDADVERSRQGMRLQRDFSHGKTRGANGEYWPVLKINGVEQWESDPDSPWQRYRRDMMAYSAVKRACRLGAPQATNQINPAKIVDGDYTLQITENARSPGDNLELSNSLTKALAEGTVDPGAVFAGDTSAEAQDTHEAGGPSTPDTSVIPPETPPEEPKPTPPTQPAAPAKAQQPARQPARATVPERPVEAPDGPVDVGTARQITAIMNDMNGSWGAAYIPVYRELIAKYQPKSERFDPNALTAKQARECLAELRRRRGDPDTQEDPPMTNEDDQKPDADAQPEPDAAPEVEVNGDATVNVDHDEAPDADDGDGAEDKEDEK